MTQIYAHRGLHLHERENTTAAFAAAVELGVDGVELDVRRAREGALVVHHDAVLRGRRVATTPREKLPPYVPTLAEALNVCRGVAVNVELKNSPRTGEDYDASGRFVHDVVATVRAARASENVLFSCFDRSTCLQLRTLDASIRVGWLLERRDNVIESLEWAREMGLDAVHPHVSKVSLGAVTLSRELGLGVNVWTVNTVKDLRAMVAFGVDSVITDEPARAISLVEAARS